MVYMEDIVLAVEDNMGILGKKLKRQCTNNSEDKGEGSSTKKAQS